MWLHPALKLQVFGMKTALEVVATGMGEWLKVRAGEKVRRLGACKEREDGVGSILLRLGAGGGKAGRGPRRVSVEMWPERSLCWPRRGSGTGWLPVCSVQAQPVLLSLSGSTLWRNAL